MSTLTSAHHIVDADPIAFNQLAVERGWGDGLPLVPPTTERVAAMLAYSPAAPAEVIAELPPLRAPCTVEKLAINAVMAGAPPAAMPLLRAAIEAMATPEYELHALNATTGSVMDALVVNGPVRHELGIPFGTSCLGGVAGAAPAIGRALRLVIRNLAGQVAGVTSQSVWGNPGRVAGVVFAEWEERSPWAPLAERRGVAGSAVTVFGSMGTMNICDPLASTADELVQAVGRGINCPGANGYLTGLPFSEVIVGLNPVWADIIGREYTDVADVQRRLQQIAKLPISDWPERYHDTFEAAGRVDSEGFVHLVADPGQIIVVVAGGLGALHAHALHSWGSTKATTWAVGG
ncbi:MAG: hypothetical protein Q7V88_14885 [Actinomycetota bacterium]|nr:hypothetical protein [Actinomycetota bacterium]